MSTSASTTGATRAFLVEWFDRLAATGFDGGVFLGALSDDLVWTATGTSPVSGTFRGKQAYVDGVWRPLDQHLQRWPRAEVLRILADGEWATVEFRGVGGLGVNGLDYSLQYCWVLRVVGDEITEVVGYYDQTQVEALFAPPAV
ncbi:nuclear transport factor 2 family protein [Pseudonocardia ailaonensis]